MFTDTFTHHGLPAVVHADSGPAMRSTVLKELLIDLKVGQTHDRPRVSNDNPFSESEFRTMKYRPNYPGTFTDLDAARAWVSSYVSWYNQHHRHGGIALFTPFEVHTGAWARRWQQRDRAQQAYYDTHPERFPNRPRRSSPKPVVGINLPTETEPDRSTQLDNARRWPVDMNVRISTLAGGVTLCGLGQWLFAPDLAVGPTAEGVVD